MQSSSLQGYGISSHDFAYNDSQLHGMIHQASHLTTYGIIHRLAQHDSTMQDRRTYLLSASSLLVLQSPFLHDTIKSLLNQPQTSLILLLPLKLVIHSAALKLTTLPRAGGSGLRILPFDPMSTVYDQDVAQCIRKVPKVKKIDGFMAFEEDGESRLRLAANTKLINGKRELSTLR